MAFEYRYRFSVDEEIIRLYNFRIPVHGGSVRFAIEVRTNFIVKGRSEADPEKIIDSERYAVQSCREDYVREDMVLRLKQYWMPDYEIDRLINEALLFAKRIAADGRSGKIPIAVNLNVYTLQQEGEAIDDTLDRAMRPEYLPPLYLCPVQDSANPNPRQRQDVELIDFLEELSVVRVNDVGKGLSMMQACSIGGRKPMVGMEISSLRCGHAFHNHCIVRRLEDDKCCPLCRPPAYDCSESKRTDQQYIFDSVNDYVPGDGGTVLSVTDDFL
ncbi:hypothetical protein OROGR_024383 [Orobanche gracilis]